MYQLGDDLVAVLESGSSTMLLRLVELTADLEVAATYELGEQAVVSGAASAEAARDVRRQASLELDATRVPATLREQGTVVRVESGALVGGSAVLVPLVTGFVTVSNATMSTARASLTVESFLSACRQELGSSVNLVAGTTLPAALHALWDPVLPFVEWVVDDTATERVLGSDVPVLPTDVRLDVGLRLARSAGCEAFDDRLGRIVVRARVDPAQVAVSRVMTQPVELSRGYSRQPFNAQPVESSPGEAAPFYVLEEVTDRASAVHRDRIGLRMAPMLRSDTIPDPDAARALARAWLAGRMLRADELSATEHARHLDLDEGDVVEREEPITGASGRYIIEGISYPLGPGTISTSERAVLPLFLTEEAT